MSRWTPCKRRDFILKLRSFGFEGPFSGACHQFMIFKQRRLAIPSNTEYSVPQLRMMVSEVEVILGREIRMEDWEATR